jgi:hypothetical protein
MAGVQKKILRKIKKRKPTLFEDLWERRKWREGGEELESKLRLFPIQTCFHQR